MQIINTQKTGRSAFIPNLFNLSRALLLILGLSLLLTSLSACDNDAPVVNKQLTQIEEKPPEPVVRYEDFKHTQQSGEVRLQFIGYSRKEGDNIWSSKTDGSDLRLVYAFKDLKPEDGRSTSAVPVRSPDNRYLAIRIGGAEMTKQIIVDLYAQSYEVIDVGFGKPMFNWSKDSKNLTFFSSGDLKRYNLETKQLIELPESILSDKLYLLKDGKTFLSVLAVYLATYNIESGKETKSRIDLEPVMRAAYDKLRGITFSDISPNEKHLYFRDMFGRGVVNLITGKALFYTYHSDEPEELSMTTGMFINNKELIYTCAPQLCTFNIFTQQRSQIPDSTYNRGRNLSIINKNRIQ